MGILSPFTSRSIQDRVYLSAVGIFVAASVIGIGFISWQLLSKRISGEITYETEAATPPADVLQAEDVVSFGWASADIPFSYKRDSTTDPWWPSIEPYPVQNRLIFLRDLKKLKGTAGVGGRWGVNVEAITQSGVTWKGVWIPGSFIWTEGPLAGYGAKFASLKEEVPFRAGVYAFADRRIKWCGKNLVRITGVSGWPGEFEKVKGQWQDLRLGKKASAAKNGLHDTVENWIRANCVVQVDEYLDPRFADSMSTIEFTLEFKFEDGREVTVRQRQDGSLSFEGVESPKVPVFAPVLSEQFRILARQFSVQR